MSSNQSGEGEIRQAIIEADLVPSSKPDGSRLPVPFPSVRPLGTAEESTARSESRLPGQLMTLASILTITDQRGHEGHD